MAAMGMARTTTMPPTISDQEFAYVQ